MFPLRELSAILPSNKSLITIDSVAASAFTLFFVLDVDSSVRFSKYATRHTLIENILSSLVGRWFHVVIVP